MNMTDDYLRDLQEWLFRHSDLNPHSKNSEHYTHAGVAIGELLARRAVASVGQRLDRASKA